ncbi:MAG: hypothetical protein NT068_00230 [Candidatus Nomurabacteria bacterium]|nr:hypothetical protein [Candidatus Nomurabacteria bacterium]
MGKNKNFLIVIVVLGFIVLVTWLSSGCTKRHFTLIANETPSEKVDWTIDPSFSGEFFFISEIERISLPSDSIATFVYKDPKTGFEYILDEEFLHSGMNGYHRLISGPFGTRGLTKTNYKKIDLSQVRTAKKYPNKKFRCTDTQPQALFCRFSKEEKIFYFEPGPNIYHFYIEEWYGIIVPAGVFLLCVVILLRKKNRIE